MKEDPEKITIIEGPPPVFEFAGDPLLLSLIESPNPSQIAMCQVRTFNGPALVERCYRAWHAHQTIHLEYRSSDGLTKQAPILAARWSELPEGHLLSLWVRLNPDDFDIEIYFGFEDEENDSDDEDDFFDDFLDDSDIDLII
ncbi:MAG: hypothetical protein JXA25_09435 [Anaerolineales bacterium]|nr:hypothetical protein [Anaerolineales bacterium]